MKYLIFFLLFSTSLFAQQQFSFKHLDCNVRFNKSSDFLNERTNKSLKDKGFVPKGYVDGNKMNSGDLYFSLEYFRDPKKLWKDCIVTIAVKKAKGQIAKKKDKTLFERSIKRSLPRHTFDGDERCKRALKDAFIHIPYCQTMTVNEKVQGN